MRLVAGILILFTIPVSAYDSCGECYKDQQYCQGKGLCVRGDDPRLVHCKCESGWFGRKCEYYEECSKNDRSCMFYGRMQGQAHLNEISRSIAFESAKGGIFLATTKPIFIAQPFRLILTYTLAANLLNYHPKVIYYSPYDFDALELLLRACSEDKDGFCMFREQKYCTKPSPRSNMCSYKKMDYYAYYPRNYSDKKRVVCIDIRPFRGKRFIEIGVKASCNNPNGCSLYKIGATTIRFSIKVEPGTCENFNIVH